jgi:hypothetical protein
MKQKIRRALFVAGVMLAMTGGVLGQTLGQTPMPKKAKWYISNFKYALLSEVSSITSTVPQRLIFTNNKLTDIYR